MAFFGMQLHFVLCLPVQNVKYDASLHLNAALWSAEIAKLNYFYIFGLF